ncbi:Trypsin alpha-4 [Lucilia cuprina]|nr:Trypsin alpha-4 [Lucilia cuprina]
MLKFIILLSAVACALGAAIPEVVVLLPLLALILGKFLYNAVVSFLWWPIYNSKSLAGSSYWNSGGVLNHEGYNPSTKVNDIAVIRLSSSLTMSSNIKAIALASAAPANGAAAVVSGWGPPLRVAAFLLNCIVGRSQCSSSTYGYGSKIKSSMICAYTVGDSGGPLVSGGRLVGVVSWGYGCAYTNYPGVYADVAALRSWVVSAANSV